MVSAQHSSTALLVMDIQESIVARYAQASELLPRINQAITAARAAEIPVIYVHVAFREGYPEVSPRNKTFAAISQRAGAQSLMASTGIHPAVAPQPTDVIITKRRVSAFTGSDLEVVLRARGLSHLVLCGIATSGVVLSTLREAADKDYELTVLTDGCADADEEVHQVLLTKVFPRQAEVVSVETWATNL